MFVADREQLFLRLHEANRPSVALALRYQATNACVGGFDAMDVLLVFMSTALMCDGARSRSYAYTVVRETLPSISRVL